MNVIRLLHELGANENTSDNDGTTPVNTAAHGGHCDVIRLLHELGADVNAADDSGRAPVHVAALEVIVM